MYKTFVCINIGSISIVLHVVKWHDMLKELINDSGYLTSVFLAIPLLESTTHLMNICFLICYIFIWI